MPDNKKRLELYIHIPFCLQKCRYCDFLSYPADDACKKSYVELLCREIKVRSSYFHTWSVSSIFVGGGTPSCLPGEMLETIFSTVYDCFLVEPDAEITIEMNPGTVDLSKLQTYKRIGINRLSIGLQATRNDMLALLGRIHTVEDFEKTYRAARRSGFDNVSIDLMSALPGQTMKDLEETLNLVAAWEPEHISCYSLIIEEGTPFFDMQDQMTFPDEDEDREMYAMTARVLEQYGYYRYEISNYAKDGRESRHNCGYWTRVPYLGVGLGAASLIEEKRFSNPREMEAYEKMIQSEECLGFGTILNEASSMKQSEAASRPKDWVTVLTKEDQMEEFMFLGLRMMQGVSREVFFRTFGSKIENVYGSVLEKLQKDGLLTFAGDWIRLTEYGIDISNYVFSQFLF